MELLDTSIANVALPHIAGGLGRSYDEVTWILTTYLVANAVILPLSAWPSPVFGRKNYYMACVALFTITSFLCGIAPSLEIMLVARVLQGIGGGGLAPVEQAILVDTFPPAKRASAFALYTVAIVTAPAIGPVLGGWITDNYNWRWVFLINIFYFVFGFGLFASTTMIPQLLQSLYGYRAIDAGLVLGPGALVITFLAPVGAQLVQRGFIKPRILLFGAVMVVGISFLHYSHFNLDTDYKHYAWARALQGL